uniref:Helitron helicase-like domain-containing protein n=1 Tax=Amphimedon queenslandica TaxID=400682 RepID=A0A1X7TE40_AMPQE
MWPSIGGTPINEFQTEGYFSMAFPILFPTGAAYFNGTQMNGITAGHYFTHLMKYDDRRFAKLPRFRFFALHTEIRWRANATGQVYKRQHPGEAHLTVDDLRDMISCEGERFSNKVVHYGASLRGTRQYWFRERNHLIAMIDTQGLSTIFFTHSAADPQWPELANLICPEDLAGSFPHVHGLAWLPNALNVEHLLSSQPDLVESTKQQIIEYADNIISTINPAVLPDGSNFSDAPPPTVDPHICNKPYSEVTDFEEDLTDLIATCQQHTCCSESYCFRTRNGKQEFRFGFPKNLKAQTTINITEEEPVILTACNDGMLNSFNPIQITSWHANVDMQYIVSRNRVVQYCTMYVTKSETRSQSLRDTFTNIACSLKEGNRSLKAVQKLLINCFGDRDFLTQETCHLLLQLPLYKASRSFINLSLDGSREVQNNTHEGERVTAHSVLNHYTSHPTTSQFNSITLLDFICQYTVLKELSNEPKMRSKEVIV